MSKHTVFKCDRCKKEMGSEAERVLALTVGRVPDPAGGRSEDDVETLELCGKCYDRAVKVGLMKLSHEQQAELLAEIRSTSRLV